MALIPISEIISERLKLSKLSSLDAPFILELLNTEEWIQFIGDRKIKNLEDAQGYITMVSNFPDMHFWVVRINKTSESIGIITLIKREYLEFYDLGFAFLPTFSKKGFAYEAAKSTLDEIKKDDLYSTIHAITLPANLNSIRLLDKLGFAFDRNFIDDNEELSLYCIKA